MDPIPALSTLATARSEMPYWHGWDLRMLCKQGRLKEALHMLDTMGHRNVKLNANTYACLLQECIDRKALQEGKSIHDHILRNGIKPDVFLGKNLVNMYLKCGSLRDAQEVFNHMPEKSVFTWTIMIAGYVQNGLAQKALELFWQMEKEGIRPDKVAFLSILKACASMGSLEQGKKIHAHIVESGHESDVFVGNSLVDMYAKCGSIYDALQVFERMDKRNAVSWNAMLAGYAQHGQGREALELFVLMKEEGVKPDNVTFVSILKACARVEALEQGKKIHVEVVKNGYESDVIVGNILIDMYAKCRCMEDAWHVFNRMPNRDIVSWTTMIEGYAQLGEGKKAFELFRRMQQIHMKPNMATFKSVLKACTSMKALELGKKVHQQIIESQFELDIFVASTLVDMYAKCGSIELARRVFDKMVKRDVVSWTAIITGYVQHGQSEKALELYKKMGREGVQPNRFTFMIILKACAYVGALEQGKQIYTNMIERGVASDVSVESTLIYMYAKCGHIEQARSMFDEMPERNLLSWNSMLAGYSQHGLVKETLELADRMQQEGVEPDDVTFVCVLSACSHAGLLEEGCHYFRSISCDHGIAVTDEHCACMVDLFGRAGYLKEAEDFVKRMPIQPSAVVWTALLGACRIYGDLELAAWAAKHILELEPQNDAAFLLLSNLYASAAKWHDKERIRKLFEDKGMQRSQDAAFLM